MLTAVTGVAGSGKSSLIHGHLQAVEPAAVVVDQGLNRGSRRSNPATYTGMLDPIRKAFAAANGVSPALFSANSKGACPDCNGLGVIYTDLAHLDPVASPCESCEGRRFTSEVLQHTLRGASIADVFDMPAETALEFFTEKPVRVRLEAMRDVGLGYVTLGQPLSTFSGGERQRLKLANELDASAKVFVLDEPTTGLHMHDVERLIGLLDRLVDGGATVVVIEHDLEVIARARLGHRPRAGRGTRRRADRVRGHARAARRAPDIGDRKASGDAPGGRCLKRDFIETRPCGLSVTPSPCGPRGEGDAKTAADWRARSRRCSRPPCSRRARWLEAVISSSCRPVPRSAQAPASRTVPRPATAARRPTDRASWGAVKERGTRGVRRCG